MTVPSADALQDAKARLLARTLQYARESIPYYRSITNSLTEQLHSFPVVDAKFLHDHLHESYRLDRFPDFVLQTGGTTGQPLLLFRRIEELEAVFFWRFGLKPGELLDPSSFDGFIVNLIDFNHGLGFEPLHGQPVVHAPVENPTNLRNAVRLLDEGLEVDGRRVPAVSLVGSTTKLKVLSGYVEMQGINPAQRWNLDTIVCHGSHVAARVRERLEYLWGCRTTTAYGLTEFNVALATECAGCRHLVVPHSVIAEILAPTSLLPAAADEGMLVLTSLAPFMTTQPLIRYATEDLVHSGPADCDRCHGNAFAFRGRRGTSLVIEDGPLVSIVITADDVSEALDGHPDVRVDDFYQRVALRLREGVPRDRRVGPPVFGVAVEPRVRRPAYRVGVEVADRADATARSARVTAARLEAALMCVPGLHDRLARHEAELSLEVLPPGGLANTRYASVVN